MCTRIDLGAGLAVQGIPLRLGTGPGTRHKPQPLRGGLHRVGLRRAHQLGELVPTQLDKVELDVRRLHASADLRLDRHQRLHELA
ncbi:hypothetical protein G6F46_015757 [Rhizopus delemar]|nr:hypothetical protein G6F24_017362 [Rhizopus arrhizus]KAG1578681.1 hypothetical protein G6F46_015757 [Rhizopus delemar]